MGLTLAYFQRASRLFDEAWARPVDERAAFLAAACGDDQRLRSEVESLLAFSHHTNDLLVRGGLPVLTLANGAREPARAVASAEDAVDRLKGEVIAHYRVEELLGSGGMGVVYRARDLALDRVAALKVLPQVFTASLRQRLIEEANMSARLQHPAIATFYESGESQGITYIAMELVEGETLRERLSRGPVTVPEAVAWTTCVLEALSHAHAAGILHRDLKPENIMITAQQTATLLDFGVARHLVLEDTEAATAADATGVISGTIGYMSPEQIRNEVLDCKSDVFQMGAVLYEALTGRPAFPGATALHRLSAVLTRDPDAIDVPDVPAPLTTIVMRALARDPNRRYVSTGAFLAELRDFSAGEWTRDLPDSIAILDFDNRTENAHHGWIATGIADALAAELRREKTLVVVPRDKVAAARTGVDAETPLEALAAGIGLRLGCRWALTGAYQTTGDALHVTLHLIETATKRTLLTATVAGTISELFELQDKLTALARASLHLQLDGQPAVARRPALSAYELYMRGRRLFLRREKGSMDEAHHLYEEAVRLEPEYALALSELARFYGMRYTFTTSKETLELAERYSRRAIASDPSLPDGYTWLAYALWRRGSSREAYEEWMRAMALDPSGYFPYYFGGSIGHLIGIPDSGLAHLQRAVALEPRLASPWLALGCLHTQLGNHPEALSCFERARRVDRAGDAPRWPGLGGFHAECLRRTGQLTHARRVCLEALEDVEKSDHMYRDSNRVLCLVTLGRIALQQGDVAAARAACGQAIAHVHGRPRTLAGGWLLTQALAGLAASGEGRSSYDEAARLYERRDRFDFSWLWFCTVDTTLRDLAGAAMALGLEGEARRLYEASGSIGSFDA